MVVLHPDPRRLLVRIKLPDRALICASMHAPQSGVERRAWWHCAKDLLRPQADFNALATWCARRRTRTLTSSMTSSRSSTCLWPPCMTLCMKVAQPPGAMRQDMKLDLTMSSPQEKAEHDVRSTCWTLAMQPLTTTPLACQKSIMALRDATGCQGHALTGIACERRPTSRSPQCGTTNTCGSLRYLSNRAGGSFEPCAT